MKTYDGKVCDDCEEEFCYGDCLLFDYESHVVGFGLDKFGL